MLRKIVWVVLENYWSSNFIPTETKKMSSPPKCSVALFHSTDSKFTDNVVYCDHEVSMQREDFKNLEQIQNCTSDKIIIALAFYTGKTQLSDFFPFIKEAVRLKGNENVLVSIESSQNDNNFMFHEEMELQQYKNFQTFSHKMNHEQKRMVEKFIGEQLQEPNPMLFQIWVCVFSNLILII